MVVELTTKASKIVVSPSAGLEVLSQSCAQKQSLLSQIGQSLLALKKEVSKKHLLNDLNKRLVQQESKSRHNDIYVECHNSTEFTWKDACDGIDDMKNAGSIGKDFH